MRTAEDLEFQLALGREARGFELKGAGLADGQLLAKVIRAALSMGNLRDGGVIVIGIDDTAPDQMLPGLTDEELASWLDYDTLAARINAHADPPLRLDIGEVRLRSQARVAVIEVHEFDDVPHICSKASFDVLRKGAVYVRTRRIPETAEIPDSTEMRDLLDLATEKNLRNYVEKALRSGVRLSVGDAAVAETDSSAEFDEQVREAWDE